MTEDSVPTTSSCSKYKTNSHLMLSLKLLSAVSVLSVNGSILVISSCGSESLHNSHYVVCSVVGHDRNVTSFFQQRVR